MGSTIKVPIYYETLTVTSVDYRSVRTLNAALIVVRVLHYDTAPAFIQLQY